MENSKIEWTDHTFNPWIGCTKVTALCQHCYAETLMATRYKRVQWGPQGTRSRTGHANWRKPITWNREAEQSKVRRRVFCASLADVYEERPELEPWRKDLFQLVDETDWLDWLTLTKRPENIGPMWSDMAGVALNELPQRNNVWLGTSVGTQATAEKYVPQPNGETWRLFFFSLLNRCLGQSKSCRSTTLTGLSSAVKAVMVLVQ